jgi:transcriptional regulator with XRE-family HTH domain
VQTSDYAIFAALLVKARRRAGISQDQLADRLPFQQVGISKIERGRRRVDVIELRMICGSLGIKLGDFITELEHQLAKRYRRKPNDSQRPMSRQAVRD